MVGLGVYSVDLDGHHVEQQHCLHLTFKSAQINHSRLVLEYNLPPILGAQTYTDILSPSLDRDAFVLDLLRRMLNDAIIESKRSDLLK